MDRNKKIIKNSIIFAIGNFGSKILAYIMVLVYTHFIGKDDLGYYDLILTTVSLLHPILLMAFDEGIYRWLISDDYDKPTVISTCLKATSLTTALSIIVLFLVNLVFHFQYVELIALFLFSSMMYSMFQNVIRGLTKNKLYAVSGLLNSFVLLLFELLFLVVFKLGIEGLLISKVIANVAAIAYIYWKEPNLHGIIKKPFEKKIAKKIFNYSMPLVPNQISWWIVNSSDRYIILAFLGVSFNGIYSISNKFPTVITTITSIVYLALQESIIKEYKSDDRDEFYSTTFQNYYKLLFALVLCAIPATKVIIECTVSQEYVEAWKYIGFLYLSTIFSALSSFLGIGYQISKETKRSVVSTISAAIVNIVINVVFIQFIGLHAATLSTLISYFALFVIRIFHSKKYFNLQINWFFFGALLLTALLVIGLSYICDLIVNIAITVLAFAAMVYMNKSMIKSLIKKKKG